MGYIIYVNVSTRLYQVLKFDQKEVFKWMIHDLHREKCKYLKR